MITWVKIYPRFTIAFGCIIFFVLLFTECINRTKPETGIVKNAKGKAFAGSASCAGCHQDIYQDFIHTSHYQTSKPASGKYIKGSFEKGKNTVAFNAHDEVRMEEKDSGHYQVEYIDGKIKRSEAFDIVIGSGKSGQTYLFWANDHLFQLPVSYFTIINTWANNPGYPGRVIYDRPITARCLECHSTYAQKNTAANVELEDFSKNQIIFGVDCERCHGPGKEHVNFYTDNPADTTGKYIINPATFTRQQKLDMCALCHGGRLNNKQPVFSFEPGDRLTDYFIYNTVASDAESIDVHGNQYGLLASSQCFVQSDLTCNSCHITHKNEAGNIPLYSARCMSCHNKEHSNFCTFNSEPGMVLSDNCIDCHMPVNESKTVVFTDQSSNKKIAATFRSHLIKIYPEQAKKLLSSMKETQIKK